MKLLKWLFGSRKPALNKPVVSGSYFSVEYYPLTKRYYPKYKDYYMIENYQTGIVEPKADYLFVYANYSDTEEGAEKIIEKFKEQQLKENVRTIEK